MSKPLTWTLVSQKAKTDSYKTIKSLNLWGNDIDDLSILEGLPNLEVLSLSVNRITTLSDISKCKKIRELYLRKNNISNLSELQYLAQLPALKVLWLQENPIADHPNYRDTVIMNSPNLEKLDDIPVNHFETQKSAYEQLEQMTPPQRISVPRVQQQFSQPNSTKDLQPAREISQKELRENAYQNQREQQNIRDLQYQRDQYNSNQPTNIRESVQMQANLSQREQLLREHQLREQQIRESFIQQQIQYQQQLSQQQQKLQELQQQQDQEQNNNLNQSYERNENILTAILTLMKELDLNSLVVLQTEVERNLKRFQ